MPMVRCRLISTFDARHAPPGGPMLKVAAFCGVVWTGACAALLFASPCHADPRSDRIMFFTYSAGYRHDVIPTSKEILRALGRSSGTFEVSATEDISLFTRENLRQYSAVMFY